MSSSKRKPVSIPIEGGEGEEDTGTTKTATSTSNSAKRKRYDTEDDWKNIMATKPTSTQEAKTTTSSTGDEKLSNKSVVDGRGKNTATATTVATTTTSIIRQPSSSSTSIESSPTNQQQQSSNTGSATRRPYRRMKRPVGYNDKSTVTISTPTARETSNVYDQVLGESEDLLRAAAEAQSLGRLKMASNYLLMLHTRLVGLGKKFDRSKIVTPPSRIASSVKPTKLSFQQAGNTDNDTDIAARGTTSKNEHQTKKSIDDENNNGRSQKDNEEKKGSPSSTNTSNGNDRNNKLETPQKAKSSSSSTSRIGISEAALHQLTNYLPSNIEMDQAMVEHLARAAAELHQKRTGRRPADEGLLNSPAMNNEEVFHYNKDNNTKNHEGGKGGGTPSAAAPSSSTSATGIRTAGTSPIRKKWEAVANQAAANGWTDEEQNKIKDAMRNTSDPIKLTQILGGTRTIDEIKLYVENVAQLEAMEKEMLDTPRKRGGRGRKPPTTAMNTVPNANLDVKTLLLNNNDEK